MSDRSGRAARFALALGSLAPVLAAAELWILPAWLDVPRDVWLMGFAADVRRVDDVSIGALGFPGDDVSQHPKPPGTLRVLTLGGSAFFNRDFTERLRRAIAAERAGGVEIVGGALRAHTSRASLLKWRVLAPHDFDVVVDYDGINDLYANHVPPRAYREDYAHLGARYVRGPLLDRSIVARLVYDRFLHRPVAGEIGGSGFRSVETLRANLRALVAEVRAAGAAPVLSTTAWTIPPDYERARFEAGAAGYVNPERYDARPVEFWGPVPFVREGLQRTNVMLHELARETGTPLFDAEAVLGRDPAWFGDVCHPNAAGADRLAAALAAFLSREGLLGDSGAARELGDQRERDGEHDRPEEEPEHAEGQEAAQHAEEHQ